MDQGLPHSVLAKDLGFKTLVGAWLGKDKELSMVAYGYDTCPMEGFDSLRVKKVLKLPY